MVTVAEIARNIGIPATTAREYVGRFKQFFPTRKVSGKRYPMHPNTAENVMRDIVEGYARNMTTDEVMNLLKEKHPISADVIDEEEPTRNTNSHSSTPTDNSTMELLTRMNNMQMQLMQRMTDVLDRNNHVMERMLTVFDRDTFPRQAALKAPEKPVEEPKQDKEQIKEQTHETNGHTHVGTNGTAVAQDEDKTSQIASPKKFTLPSKEELEKRRNKSWLSRMFGA